MRSSEEIKAYNRKKQSETRIRKKEAGIPLVSKEVQKKSDEKLPIYTVRIKPGTKQAYLAKKGNMTHDEFFNFLLSKA